MKRPPTHDEFEQLLSRIAEDHLDGPGYERLMQMLAAHPELRDSYVDHVLLHADLEWTRARSTAGPAAARLRSIAPLAIAAAIVLGIGLLMSLLLAYSWQRHDRLTTEPRMFATLIDARGAVFGESDVPTSPGSQLSGGFVRLTSGEVDIEFFSGAQVTLRGPAVFGINSAMRGFLERGSLRAHCPPQAKGFTIGAPGVAVVDLGTRFTMSVDEAGVTQVEVTEGSVAMDAGDEKTIALSVGESARVEGDRLEHTSQITIPSAPSDGLYSRAAGQGVSGPWGARASSGFARVGFGGSAGMTPLIAALPLRLPVLDAAAEMGAVELQLPLLEVQAHRTLSFGLDLYGLPGRNTPALRDSEFHVGGLDPNATLLAAEVVGPGSKPGVVVIRSEALSAYIRSLYGPDGKPRHQWAMLRLNPNRRAVGAIGYVIGFNEDATRTLPGPRLILRAKTTSVR